MPLRDAGIKLIDCVHKTPAVAGQGFPYIAIPQLTEERIDVDSARRISEQDMLKWNVKCNPQEDDVILSRRCNPEVTAVVPKHFRGSLGQNLVLLRATDPNLMAPKYLRWATRGREWWNEVGKFINVGAVFESLRCVDIPDFPFQYHQLPSKKQSPLFHLRGPDADGQGYESPGGFTVLEGSRARLAFVESTPASVIAFRGQLTEQGLFRPEGQSLILTQSYEFNSPSQAAALLLARSANGLLEWKAVAGLTLGEHRRRQLPQGVETEADG